MGRTGGASSPGRVGAALLLGIAAGALQAGCGADPVAPEDRLELQASSAHFTVYAAPGDAHVDLEWQERHLEWASALLDIQPTEVLVYHKYRDTEHLVALTGHQGGTGFAEAGTYRFHSVWTRDNHEYVHSLFNTTVGGSPPLFSEGIAVAHHGASLDGSFDGDPRWSGRSVHDIAREYLDAGDLPPPATLAVHTGFRAHHYDLTYPVAGSFVRWLIDTEGIDRLKDFVRRTGGPGDDLARIRGNVRAAYGVELETLWERWLAFLAE